MFKVSSFIRPVVVALAMLSLGACASIPYARTYESQGIEQPADGSPERAALNAEVYDAVVRYTEKLFYKPDFGGVPFVAEAEARRAEAVAQPTSDGLHVELTELLDLLNDDHTVTLSPLERERYYELLKGGQATGYGFTVTPRGDERFVATVVPGSPAELAGVMPGWRIESAGGLSVLLAIPPVVGRTDTLVFVDDADQRHSLDLTGMQMPLRPRFVAERRDGNIAYIRFDDFDRPRYDQLKAEMQTFADDPPAGLIIDLRTNGGGELRFTGLALSWLFAEKQAFVVVEGRFVNERLTVVPPPQPYLGPVVMLIGPGTASAAEILSGVAQEKGRATIVGLRSRGAVTGTQPIELPDGGLLRVGSIVMTTPGGHNLEGTGVAPDIEVPDDWAARRAGRDPTLEAGIAALDAIKTERDPVSDPIPAS
jgi:carboxyl-terminal processing protease